MGIFQFHKEMKISVMKMFHFHIFSEVKLLRLIIDQYKQYDRLSFEQ